MPGFSTLTTIAAMEKSKFVSNPIMQRLRMLNSSFYDLYFNFQMNRSASVDQKNSRTQQASPNKSLFPDKNNGSIFTDKIPLP